MSVRDVSELKKLEQLARKNQEELTIIGEIADIWIGTYNTFIAGGRRLLANNRDQLVNLSKNAGVRSMY
ncbi:MAG: hypothetical protein HQK54_14105 [Oligoflexales bacterium]|nr:hypothetical protein [Oligoflexales bacterium]